MASKKTASTSTSKGTPIDGQTITREEFLSSGPLTLTINGKEIDVDPRTFSTGSIGFNINQPITLEVNGQKVAFTFNGNLFVKNSKPK